MYSLGSWKVGIAVIIWEVRSTYWEARVTCITLHVKSRNSGNHLGSETDILGSDSDMYSLGTWEVEIAVIIWEVRPTYWEARVTCIHLARGK